MTVMQQISLSDPRWHQLNEAQRRRVADLYRTAAYTPFNLVVSAVLAADSTSAAADDDPTEEQIEVSRSTFRVDDEELSLVRFEASFLAVEVLRYQDGDASIWIGDMEDALSLEEARSLRDALNAAADLLDN